MKKMVVPVLAASLTLSTFNAAMAAPKEEGKIKSVEFIGMDAPKTDQEKNNLMYTRASVKVTYNDGTKKTVPLSYETLFRPGDVINGNTAGVTINAKGEIMTKANGKPYVSSAPDMNSLMKVPGLPENTYYLISHYESMPKNENGLENPGAMSLSTVKMDPATGKLTVVDIKPIDFSEVHGIWKPCAGILTPWNTHLGSEETDPDARAHEVNPTSSAVTNFTKNYYGDASLIGNPYYYGHVPEVTVKADGSTKVVKHYSMGRMAFERVKVMPDNKTVIYGVDSNPGGFFMYVADQEKDLSAGTLYAAKWVQTGTENGGSAKLEWVKLGHATDQEIEKLASTLKFSDMFEVTDDAAKGKAEGYTAIKTAANGKKVEWVKVKPGMEKAAAFLETHRYAAYLGATVEFNKMEGLDFNEKDNKAYLAISYQENTMLPEPTAPVDHIQLPKISAGGIYEIDFKPNRKTTDGQKIDSHYVPVSMAGYLMGEDLAAPDADGNTANVDKIANPDNVVYSEKMKTLFIGEDSGLHQNNYTWAYNVETKKLSRILSVPGGGESTGLQMLENLDGHAYLMNSSQNPAYVGYISGLPSFDEKKNKK
ncbi:alkaline phosphatase PhoX [Neobacillus sp. 114]|uniref:PhoX family protein n=1 Tax=Neobacillus sp. 114 TaxID=3048535 RepID=UPI0024C36CB3|nr:alkaline phosphatase PhoX [Neobacillus sp. 114]